MNVRKKGSRCLMHNIVLLPAVGQQSGVQLYVSVITPKSG